MFLQILLAVGGLGLLTVAADHLVLGSSRLARRLRIPPVVVGVVIIGLGTSAPEFLVSGVAAARGDAGIAVGNIVGSNILNLTLILGVAGVVGSVSVTSAVIRREVPLAVGAVVVFAFLAWSGLSPLTGAVLAAAAAGAVILLLRWAGQGRRGDHELAGDVEEFTDAPAAVSLPVQVSQLPGWFEPVRAVLALAGVLVGAQLLVANAAAIAADFGVSQIIIGFTLVAVGTSLPELVTAVAAERRGESDLVVGNLFGSNLFNSLGAGALVGFASGASPTRADVTLLVAMILTSGLAWALLRRGLTLNRVEGLALLAAYALTLPMLLSS